MNERFYASIIELINAYEKGLINSITKKETETTSKILMMGPLLTMEASLEAGELGFDVSFAQSASLIKQEKEAELKLESQKKGLSNKQNYKEVVSIQDEKGNTAHVFKQKENEYDLLYQECLIDGQNVNSTSKGIFRGDFYMKENNLEFDKMYSYVPKTSPTLKFGYKATSDFKYNLDIIRNKNVSKYLDEKMASFDSNGDGIPDKVNIFGWKTNFGLENCLNCVFDIKLSLFIPSLEWAFDLSKLMKKIQNLLSKMRAALDPTGLMVGICAFLEALKNNGLCPKNLPPLAMLLPTIFSKFTFDMISVRLNLTGLFLPLIKTVLNSIISTLENVPKLVNPIFDCLINSFIGINYLIKNYIGAFDKIVNESINTVNTLANAPTRLLKNTKNLFSFLTTSDEDIMKEINELLKESWIKLEKDVEEFKKQMKALEEKGFINDKLYDEYVIELYELLDGTSLVDKTYDINGAKQKLLSYKSGEPYNPALGPIDQLPFSSDLKAAMKGERKITLVNSDTKIIAEKLFKKWIIENYRYYKEESDKRKSDFRAYLFDIGLEFGTLEDQQIAFVEWLNAYNYIIVDVNSYVGGQFDYSLEEDGFGIFDYLMIRGLLDKKNEDSFGKYNLIGGLRALLDKYLNYFIKFNNASKEAKENSKYFDALREQLDQKIKANMERVNSLIEDKNRRKELVNGSKIINEPTRRNIFTSQYQALRNQLNNNFEKLKSPNEYEQAKYNRDLDLKFDAKEIIKNSPLGGITQYNDPLLATYGVQGKVNYIEEPPVISYKSMFLKEYNKSSVNTIIERIIFRLKEAKAYVKTYIGQMINALKALNLFFKEALDMDFAINGSILEILQIIRFIRLVHKLISSGLTDCKKIKQNPKLANEILSKMYPNSKFKFSNTSENKLDSAISSMTTEQVNNSLTISKANGAKYHVDANHCSEINKVKLNDKILEQAYDKMLNDFYSRG